MNLGKKIRKLRNPAEETRIYLAKYIKRNGFEIGAYSYGNPKIRFPGWAKLRIGKFCSIADKVEIFLGGQHHAQWACMYPFSIYPKIWPVDNVVYPAKGKGDVVIGNDVWIASGATILPNVTIGNGAIVAARSVVTKDVPPYTMVAGNPAQIVKTRFDSETIAKLESIQWWDLPRERIATLIPLLQSERIDELVAEVRNL